MAESQTVKQYFNSLSVIHLGLIGGQVLFALVVSFVSDKNGFGEVDTTLKTIFELVSLVLLILGYFLGRFLFRSKMRVVGKKKSLLEKLVDYRSILIIRYALLEVPSFFALISYLLTGDEIFLLIVALVIFIFILLRPSPEMAIKSLDLDHPDASVLREPGSALS